MRGMVKRGHRKSKDSTRGGPGDQVIRGGEERGDLKGRALVLTNDWIVGCTVMKDRIHMHKRPQSFAVR